MKTNDIKIIAMLKAFDHESVLKAFDLYVADMKGGDVSTKDQLIAQGWSPQKEKPKDQESYFLDDEYWVQSEEMRQKQKDEMIEAAKNRKPAPKKKYTGQEMDLNYTDLKCPKCNAGMYKQSICPGCKDGKKGFKMKLICEDNPDHEINL